MTLKLSAKIRTDLGKKASDVRADGKIPAVIYGHKVDNVNLELNYVEFEKALKVAGESTIIDVAIDGQESRKALISEVQYEPVKGFITHVDLHQINMKEKINANIEIKLVGESRPVKEDGAVIIHNIHEVEVRCMPGDLVHEIDVDISALDKIDDSITIADLKVPASIEILHHEPEDVVALVVMPKVEKEEPVVIAPTEGAAPAAGAEGAEKAPEKK